MIISDRTKGIGGSDAASACRKSKWRSPVDVYLEKIGEGEAIEDNEIMLAGRIHEEAVLSYYEYTTGNTLKLNEEWIDQARGIAINPEYASYLSHHEDEKVSKYEHFFKHPIYDYFYAHVDGITDSNIIVESKFITNPVFSEWIDPVSSGYDNIGSIPLHYYYQIMFYLMVTGFHEAHLVAMIPSFSGPHRIYRFKRDIGFILKMRLELKIFWLDNVSKRIPPTPMTRDEVKKLTPIPITDKYKEADIEEITLCQDLLACTESIKHLTKKKNDLQDKIASVINDGEGLKKTNESGKVITLATYKASKAGKRTLRVRNG